jgi:hypothetical protein
MRTNITLNTPVCNTSKAIPMRPSNPTGVEEVRYRPLRKRGALPALWIFFSLTMIFAFYFEWQQMLPAQLALGLDPIACAELFVVASVSQIALVGILFASAYRAVASQGSIAVVGDRVEGDLAGRRFSFPSASLRNIAAGIGGTNIRLRFEEILLRLPGLWMPSRRQILEPSTQTAPTPSDTPPLASGPHDPSAIRMGISLVSPTSRSIGKSVRGTALLRCSRVAPSAPEGGSGSGRS